MQAQLKDSQLSSRDANQVQMEMAVKLKELEKKIRNLEGDVNQAQEVGGGLGAGPLVETWSLCIRCVILGSIHFRAFS